MRVFTQLLSYGYYTSYSANQCKKDNLYLSGLDSSSSIIDTYGPIKDLYDLDFYTYQSKKLRPDSALITHIYLNESVAKSFTAYAKIQEISMQ